MEAFHAYDCENVEAAEKDEDPNSDPTENDEDTVLVHDLFTK